MNQYYLIALLWASLALGCTSAWEVAQNGPNTSTSLDPVPTSQATVQYGTRPQDAATSQRATEETGQAQEAESFFDFIAGNPNEQASSPAQVASQESALVNSANYRQTQALPPTLPSHDQLVTVDRSLLMEWKQTLDAILMTDGAQATPTPMPSRSDAQPHIPAATAQVSPQINRPASTQPRAAAQANPVQVAQATTPAPAAPAATMQSQWSEFDDPNDLMFQEMEQRMEIPQQRNNTYIATQPRPQQAMHAPVVQPVAAKPAAPQGMVPIQVSPNHQVYLNERMLQEWENALIATRQGRNPEVAMPTWLLQGLEWLSDAPSAEPGRSQVLMPLYRFMKDSNYFTDVNLNKMTPGQIVAKLRMLVEDAKIGNGPTHQGR